MGAGLCKPVTEEPKKKPLGNTGKLAGNNNGKANNNPPRVTDPSNNPNNRIPNPQVNKGFGPNGKNTAEEAKRPIPGTMVKTR
jgi:hypothetical protein